MLIIISIVCKHLSYFSSNAKYDDDDSHVKKISFLEEDNEYEYDNDDNKMIKKDSYTTMIARDRKFRKNINVIDTEMKFQPMFENGVRVRWPKNKSNWMKNHFKGDLMVRDSSIQSISCILSKQQDRLVRQIIHS